MKVTVFSAKGGVGKTPISVNIALDRGWGIATNELYHVLDSIAAISPDRKLTVTPNEPFPNIPPEIDVVFDLGGTLGDDTAPSIRSAVEQSDLVLVPVTNEFKAINSAYQTIREVAAINPQILIVGTKLQKLRGERFDDWQESAELQNIHSKLTALLGTEYPAVPLKFSKGFDTIFDRELSLRQLVRQGGIDAYTYSSVAQQFDEIYQHIDGRTS